MYLLICFKAVAMHKTIDYIRQQAMRKGHVLKAKMVFKLLSVTSLLTYGFLTEVLY